MSMLDDRINVHYTLRSGASGFDSYRPPKRQRTNLVHNVGRVAVAGAYAAASTLKTISEANFYGGAVTAMDVVAEQATSATAPAVVATAAVVLGNRNRWNTQSIEDATQAPPAPSTSRQTRGYIYGGRVKSLRSYKRSVRPATRIK